MTSVNKATENGASLTACQTTRRAANGRSSDGVEENTRGQAERDYDENQADEESSESVWWRLRPEASPLGYTWS